MTFTKTSQKFGQWADSRANTVFGLGFPSEQQLTKVTGRGEFLHRLFCLLRVKNCMYPSHLFQTGCFCMSFSSMEVEYFLYFSSVCMYRSRLYCKLHGQNHKLNQITDSSTAVVILISCPVWLKAFVFPNVCRNNPTLKYFVASPWPICSFLQRAALKAKWTTPVLGLLAFSHWFWPKASGSWCWAGDGGCGQSWGMSNQGAGLKCGTRAAAPRAATPGAAPWPWY